MANQETILLLSVRASASKESSTYIGFDFISTSPSLLLPNVQQLGWDLLPGVEEIHATYLDGEGDRCTLTDCTAPDALSCAVQKDENSKVLEVQVQDRAEALKAGQLECSTCVGLRSMLARSRQETADAQQRLAGSHAAPRAEVKDALEKTLEVLEKALEKKSLELQAVRAELNTRNDEVVRLAALNDSLPAEVVAARQHASVSARVLSASVSECSPLMLGIEASEDASKRGDASQDFKEDLKCFGAQQAYRLGSIQLTPASSKEDTKQPDSVPACAKLTLVNNGTVCWPDTTALVIVSGDSCGIPLMALGPKPPGESEEVVMDLLVPPRLESSASCSMWAVVNAATGTSLGPLLVLEVTWQSQ